MSTKGDTFFALVWLVLCASLVTKHNELIYVFFAFVGSFALAALLLSGNESSLWPANMLAPLQRAVYARTKKHVGLLACTICFWCLSCRNGDGDYLALAVATGYVAFDLWYTSMFCRPKPPPLFAMMEDALTLTVFLVVLSLHGEKLADHHTHVCAWVTYKTVRLILSLSNSQTTTSDTPQMDATPKKLSDRVMATATPKARLEQNTTLKDDELWTIHGVRYDLSSFVNRHPGGKEAIELGRGRDCTALFESYHPFTTQHRIVLRKFHAVDTKNKKNTSLCRSAAETDPFYDLLKQRATDVLLQHGIDPEADRCATPFRVAYYLLVFSCLSISAMSHVKGSVLGSVLFAVFGWLIGSLGHDAGHFAVSRHAWINDWCLFGMAFLCNPVLWQHQHTYAHHSHTNEFDKDPDLHHFDTLLRVHRKLQHNDIHRNQSNRWYVMFAYAFVVFGECFWVPLGVMKEGSLYGLVEWTDRKRPLRALGMFLHTVCYVVLIMVCPFFTNPSWISATAAVVLHLATSGLLFGVFSQINHLNEHSIEADAASSKRKHQETGKNSLRANSWAATQVETSNNFATNSFLWHLLSNGLNLQIEHHLFPGLNHCHLHVVAPVVRKTCKEYGVSYKSYETWADLMDATLEWFNVMSQEPSDIVSEKAFSR